MKHQPWSRRLAAAAVVALTVVAATDGCGSDPAPDPVVPGQTRVWPPGCGGSAALSAAQAGHAYQAQVMFAAGVTGAGTTVAVIVPYAGPDVAADLAAWSRGSGLPAPRVQEIRYDRAPDVSGPPGTGTWDGVIEGTRALEMVHLLAPQAALLYVAVPPETGSLLAPGGQAGAMYDQGLAWLVATRKVTVVSYSSGIPEAWARPAGYRPILGSRAGLEAAARAGVTVVASAGDFGPTEPADSAFTGLYPSPVVAWPASDPLVTAVGTSMAAPLFAGLIADAAQVAGHPPARPREA